MTKYLAFILAAGLTLCAIPALARAQNSGDRVCLYKHDDFHGHEQCYGPGDEVSDLKHTEFESVRIYGHARAILYEDKNYKGHMIEFSADIPDLKKSWNKNVGSIRVMSDYKSERVEGRYKPYPAVDTLIEGVCVYEKPNFQGDHACWPEGIDVSNLNSFNWDNRISSVRIFGHARLLAYKDSEFRGERVMIDHDVSDLGALDARTTDNWNHEISSIAVQ